MPTLTRLTARLPVRDLRRTIAFYAEHLGFRAEVLWPEVRPTFAILSRGSTRVGFFEPNDGRPGRIGDAELYFDVADGESLYRVLAERVSIEWGPEVYSYGRREFALRDPDGYLLIFTEPTDEPPTSSEPEP